MQARYEPPFLSPHRMQLSDWGPLLSALESLIMRCAALESILESDEPLLHQTQLADTLGGSPCLPACTCACLRASMGRPCALNCLIAPGTSENQPSSCPVPVSHIGRWHTWVPPLHVFIAKQ